MSKHGFSSRGLWLCLITLLLLSSCQIEEMVKSIPLLGTIYRIPDLDQRFTEIPIVNLLIKHRSILTHNAALPVVVALGTRSLKKWGMILSGVIGTLFAFHFLLDLFPKKWSGYALIHVPLLGWMDWLPVTLSWFPKYFSITWLALNLLLSQFFFVWVFSRND